MSTIRKNSESATGSKEKDFSLLSAIVIVILLLTFLSSSIYIMMSSLP